MEAKTRTFRRCERVQQRKGESMILNIPPSVFDDFMVSRGMQFVKKRSKNVVEIKAWTQSGIGVVLGRFWPPKGSPNRSKRH